MIDKLKSDNTLDESLRMAAPQIADARLWEDVEKLKKQSSDSTGPGEKKVEAQQ